MSQMEPPSVKLKGFVFGLLAILLFLASPSAAITQNATTNTNATVHRNISNLAASAALAADDFWYTQMEHGQSPFAPAGYKVYRNVKDYGAVG